jgi:hypothetical protein
MSVVSTNRKSKIENRKLGAFSVEWDPRLVEEAVLFAAEGRRVHGFRGARNRLYEIPDPEQRDVAFREFHADWFERLELGRVLWQALKEQPVILTSTRACIVVHTRGNRDEGAELFVSPAGQGTGETERRSVGIRLDSRKLLDVERLLAFLRHELFHIADMLDPAFAYEPRLPRGELGPAHERLLQDRYRVLWDIYIDGRLVHKNWAPPSVRDRRLEEFFRTFPMLLDNVEEVFSHFFHGASLTHTDLVTFATNPPSPISNFQLPVSNLAAAPCLPLSLSPSLKEAPHAGTRCPLCGFPTYSFEPNPDRLPGEVVARIRADFATWQPSLGLCQQCSDLYRSRAHLTTAS